MPYPELGLSVRDALALPALRGARVVAGHEGLDRVIRRVNVMEVPDILEWVREGEFLVTTGYPIRDDPAAQARLIPELDARGVAGLGIKPRRYLRTIPEVMLRQAGELAFPLLELPLDLSFADVINPVAAEILQRQTSFLHQSEALHSRLTEVVLRGRGLAALAEGLWDLTGCPVLVHSAVAHVQAAAPDTQLVEALAAAPEVPEADDGSPAADPIAALERFRLFRRSRVRWQGQLVGRITVPVLSGAQTFGSLSVWETEKPLGRLGYLALERATTIAAFEIVRHQAISEVERRYRNVFLDQLLSGALESRATALERARMLGWRLDGPLSALVVEAIGARGEGARPEAAVDVSGRELYDCVVQAVSGGGPMPDWLVVGEKAGRVAVLVLQTPAGGGAPRCAPREVARRIARMAQAAFPSGTVRVGIGREVDDPLAAGQSYREALQALATSRPGPGQPAVVHFSDLGVMRLLHQLGDSREALSFYLDTVEPVARYDAAHGTQLLQTLQAFLECHGNVREAARRLFVHYNTVVYRLSRIRQITGFDLADPDARLSLQVGLKLGAVLGEESLGAEKARGQRGR